ncbi:MAG: hypothetical protein U5L07_13065 [Desulfobacterales bacterium]|nr:hypothetical protein [Desulfobacterales bacterium]
MRIQTHLKLPEKEFDPAYRAVIDAYNAFPLLHQTIVQILAIIYEGVVRTHVVKAGHRACLKKDRTNLPRSSPNDCLLCNGAWYKCAANTE